MAKDKPIPLAQINPSPTNPRRHGFAPDDLADLTASIKEKGVLYPVTVRVDPKRPMLDKKGNALPTPYELVDGERRFRAALFAGLEEIPAHVVDMTDDQVLDAQLISFDQKVDLLPSERAAAYQRKLDAGDTPEQIAAKVGRSVSYVRNVLKTARLSEEFLAHVDAGRVPRATAELVARVPGDKARHTVELCVLQHAWPGQLNGRAKPADEPLSYRDTKRVIEAEFQVELKRAPWAQSDALLVPTAGACESCPKRAGNAGDEYADLRADMCLDPACYRGKLAAFRKREEAEAEASGKKVLAKAESDKAFSQHNGSLHYDCPYVDLAAKCYEDAKQRTYAKLLAKSDVETVIGYHPRTGERFELADKAAVGKVLTELGIRTQSPFGGRPTGPKSDAEKREDAKRRHEAKVDRLTTAATLTALADGAESLYRGLFQGRGKTTHESLGAQVLRAIAVDRILRADSSTAEAVCHRRGLEAKTAAANRDAIEQATAGMGAAELLGLLAELVGHGDTRWGTHGELGLADLLTVDRKAIEKQVRERLQAERTAKAKPSANGHAKAPKAKKRKKARA